MYKSRTFFTLLVVTFLVLSLSYCKYDRLPEEDVMDFDLIEAVKNASQDGNLDQFILPTNNNLSEIPQDPENPLTYVKIQLGQYLFFETGIALNPMQDVSSESWSCATCHIPEAGFRPGIAQGIADGGVGFGLKGEGRTKKNSYPENALDAQGVRPLSVLNVAMVTNTFWNGQFGSRFVNEGTEEYWSEEDNTHINELGYRALESQNIEGMELHRLKMSEEISQELGYKIMFDEAFPEYSKDERYSNFTASLAISAYLRSLLTTQAPFQKWLKGDRDAMSIEEKRGGLMFFGEAGCYKCHYEANLGSMEFRALGVNDLYQNGGLKTSASDKKNLGRGGFTGKETDMYKFRVPQLYNLKGASPYFHGGSKETLDEVIDYFNEAVPENSNVPEEQIARAFTPLNLSEQEMSDLKVFLEDALYDPNIMRYVPSYIKSGNCFPNNDSISRIDLDCY